jgi:hypothetical protein
MHVPQTEIILRQDGRELARVTRPPVAHYWAEHNTPQAAKK